MRTVNICPSELGARFSVFLAAAISIFLPTKAAGQSCAPPPAGLVGWLQGEGMVDDLVGFNLATAGGNATFPYGMVGPTFSFPPHFALFPFVLPPPLHLPNLT